jgi:hypothetical protein
MIEYLIINVTVIIRLSSSKIIKISLYSHFTLKYPNKKVNMKYFGALDLVILLFPHSSIRYYKSPQNVRLVLSNLSLEI